MRFKIQYLSESTDERSVCRSILSDAADLACAQSQARARLGLIERAADGYQIRDLETGKIVSLECFNL